MGRKAAVATTATDSPSYHRVTDTERVLILKLKDDGFTQVEIAQRLGRSQSTISDILEAFADTRDLAKRYLDGQAAKMAENIVINGRAADHVKVLEGLEVLKAHDVSPIVNVLVGM